MSKSQKQKRIRRRLSRYQRFREAVRQEIEGLQAELRTAPPERQRWLQSRIEQCLNYQVRAIVKISSLRRLLGKSTSLYLG